MPACRHGGFALLLALVSATPAGARDRPALAISAVEEGPGRPATVEDISRRRIVDTVSLSPDRRRFAIFVRQARPAGNDFLTGWFVGPVDGGALTYVGDGGDLLPQVMHTGHKPGRLSGGHAAWSPDQRWIAYTARRNGEVQLWRSRTDGSRQEQLTRAAGDVRDFAWSDDGGAIHFTTERPRAERQRQEEAARRAGLRYREDLWQFTDLLGPALIRPREIDPTVWTVSSGSGAEPRTATPAEREAFVRQKAHAQATVESPSPDLRGCAGVDGGDLICILATSSRPDHLVVADSRARVLREVADLNPEFRRIRLGRTERIEWETPRYAWNAASGPLPDLYPEQAHGYVIYPPDFVPGKRYPVFIDPYVADGFEPLGAEHALQAYAANGMIVLRSAFPLPTEAARQRLGAAIMSTFYSEELGFPHLNMLMDSTLAALDILVARGVADPDRVGIGGVSHGTFVPLYLMQRHDRITAISISSPNWGFLQYYWGTRASAGDGNVRAFPSPEGDGRAFWRQIDIADHLDQIEAPILMNLAAHETYAMVRLIRLLADSRLPHDVYVFPDETHMKWQPAHLEAIMHRNLDWFRFWLQDIEDSNPEKAGQYVRWRQLRELQCRNPRSLRDHCRGDGT